MRKESEVGDLGGHKKHCGSVPAGGHTGSAADAVSRIKCLFGIVLPDWHRIGIRSLTGVHRNKSPRLNDFVKTRPIRDQILDHREGLCPPWLHRQRLPILKRAEIDLTSRGSLVGSVRFAIDGHRTGTANPLSAVMIKSDRLFSVLRQSIIHHIQHLQKGHVRIQAVRLMGLKMPFGHF